MQGLRDETCREWKRPKKLSADDTLKLIASGALPSFHNVVEELVLNSIDAGATSINVSVNISSQSLDIEVRDNGK
jgi:DNA mismatch repair ATPase MutL